jgi:mannose-6-phosphate isomerase-like protein (cupin superfamily)
MQATAPKGLLGAATLHARIEDIKRGKGAPPWSEKLVVNDQIVGTLICQPAGHKTDTHYHLVDEWWVVLEGEIDWVEGAEVVRARAGDVVYAPAMHYHHIKPTGSGPSIRLAITPPGEFHRHDRPAGQGPNGA